MQPHDILAAHDRLVEGFDREAFETIMDVIPYLVSLWVAAKNRGLTGQLSSPSAWATLTGALATLEVVDKAGSK